ncbi:DUF6233 domain-containing protein [Streptomyces virginiae]|uniref:DUF6233 domain-containing protein n=1 Tax=Streptomyces virginiae TaxID=1961 RepID=UPI0035E2C65B
MELAEYSTWATAAQLRLLPGVDLGGIPAHPRTRTSAASRWAWLLDGRIHGRPATVHAEGRRSATDRAHPLGTLHALDALARSGRRACTVCDAAKVLLPQEHPDRPSRTRTDPHQNPRARDRLRPRAEAERFGEQTEREQSRGTAEARARAEKAVPHPPPAPSHGSRA